MRNSSVVTKDSAEGGRGSALGTRAEIPLWPVEKAMMMQVVPLKPMEDLREAGLHPAVHAVHPGCDGAAACGEPNQRRFLAGAVAHGVCMLEQYSPEGLHT